MAVVVLVSVSLSVVFLNPPTAANGAESTQQLDPTGYAVGSVSGTALVVYDPSSNGTAKGVASQIASDLQAQGDFVYLTPIDSTTSKSDVNQCQFIVVGGPTVNGEASSLVQSYLKNLTPANGTLIGVFGVGSSNVPGDKLALIPSGKSLPINVIEEINPSQDISSQSAVFVAELLS